MVRRLPLVALALASSLLASLGCRSERGDSVRFAWVTTELATRRDDPVEVRGILLAMMADEFTQGRTDLNGDGDALDQVPHIIDMRRGNVINTGVAAQTIHHFEQRTYGVVPEEADDFDWNGDGDLEDTVLLELRELLFVDTIETDVFPPTIASEDRVYYRSATPGGPDATRLAYVESDRPLDVVRVASAGGENFDPRVLHVDEGLLFAWLDETVEMADLNDDGDAEDEFVLALHDTTSPAEPLWNVGLALDDTDVPLRAKAKGRGDWLVAFPVSEAATGTLEGGGFNDRSAFEGGWFPVQCLDQQNPEESGDDDLDDEVLHFLGFADFVRDPSTFPPINTGLVSTRSIAILLKPVPFIATISREADEGGCDLNTDGDESDFVVRWVEARTPVLPFFQPRRLVATVDVAGGTRGLAEFDDRFVIVASESGHREDYDLDGDQSSDVVGWIDPTEGIVAQWEFMHGLEGRETPIGSAWLQATRFRGRDHILSGFQESVFGRILNDDDDVDDSLPSWGRLSSRRIEIDLAIPAVDADNAGIVPVPGSVFYRAQESAIGADQNRDNDTLDMILVRVPPSGSPARVIGTLNDIPAPALVTDPRGAKFAGAFIFDERMDNTTDFSNDRNGDGDNRDLVVHYLRF